MTEANFQDNLISVLYHEMFPMLLAYARSALGDSDMAEEAVQEAFCVACNRQRELAESPNPRGWLVNTLKNVIRQFRRDRARDAALLSALTEYQDEASVSLQSGTDPDLLYGDLQHDPDYLLLKRLAVKQYTMAELAAELGISVEACKSGCSGPESGCKSDWKRIYEEAHHLPTTRTGKGGFQNVQGEHTRRKGFFSP